VTTRAIASLVAASLALGSAGCGEGGSSGAAQDLYIATMTAPIWVPAVLIYCAAGNCKNAGAEKVDAATREAAEKGDAEAQFKLGAMYGVLRDDGEAAKWYQKSADQGFGHAQFRLGTLYEAGFGVAKDYVQADTWYTIAASAEKITATEREEAIRWRDSIEKRMNPEQIAEAKRRAQEWKPSTSPREAVRNPGNDPTSSMGVSP
jgi:TPR repeat protein